MNCAWVAQRVVMERVPGVVDNADSEENGGDGEANVAQPGRAGARRVEAFGERDGDTNAPESVDIQHE